MARRWDSALVTGASSGLGAALAQRLAAQGTRRLVLTGRDAARLQAVAAALGGVEAECIACDLADPAARGALAARIADAPPDLLVNNAGAGHYGNFDRIDRAALGGSIEVNIRALVDLSHAYVGAARARGRGDVLQVGSAVAFVAVPYEAVYAATKAFVVSFSEALAEELRGSGVRIRCVCPGFIATDFAARAGLGARVAPSGSAVRPDAVAAAALATFDSRRVTHLTGAGLQAAALAVRLVPRPLVTRWTARWMRRGLPD